MKDYDDFPEDDSFELEKEENINDDFDKRTWEIKRTVPGGFAVGACFTYRDILCMKEMIPCLEGTLFVNTKTGKERTLRNKECNIRKIIKMARAELADTEYEFILQGLSYTRQSVDLLVKRINKYHAESGSAISKMNFIKLINKYFGEDVCQ